jgi:hypothetical protein
MASFNKFNLFVQDLVRGAHNLNSDTIKVALSNTTVTATNAQLSDITQVASGNGYTTGGNSGGAAISANVTGTETVRTTSAIPAWTASSSGFTLRYVVAYNDTNASDRLIGWWDYGSGLTLSGANGDTFTVTGLNTSIFTLA